MKHKHRTCVTVLCLMCSVSTLHAETVASNTKGWPQWRGPARDGQVHGHGEWPGNLKNVKEAWRVELGPSYSGPIIGNGMVFVTETKDRKEEVVRAFDRATGKEKWQHKWDGAMSVPFFAKANGDWIRATPAFDGETLFVAGMLDMLVAIDANSGKQKWSIDFPAKYKTQNPPFGFVCSPLVTDDAVYVQVADSLVKINKTDGEVLWRSLASSGGMQSSAFSSPVIATLHGQEQLLVQTRQTLHGIDMASGESLWSVDVPAFRGMNILTPTVYKDGILTSTHRNATYFYQVSRDGNDWSVKEKWQNKGKGYMSSPIMIGKHGYLHLGNGRLSCLDCETGDELWRSDSFGKYWSMIANRDKMLALSDEGELLLIKHDPEKFNLLDKIKIADQPTWGHIAIDKQGILVRELEAITALTWE
ncbi:MAG: PQQ-binding-like beta-propeller repeat protein [Phycisphaerae bacterium]